MLFAVQYPCWSRLLSLRASLSAVLRPIRSLRTADKIALALALLAAIVVGVQVQFLRRAQSVTMRPAPVPERDFAGLDHGLVSFTDEEESEPPPLKPEQPAAVQTPDSEPPDEDDVMEADVIP